VTGGGGALAGGFTAAGLTTNAAGAYGGWNIPDIVGNLRVDQTWGSAQVMGALHQVNTTYYTGSTSIVNTANPSDAWGFVVGGGIKLNNPMWGPGDYFQAEINYTQGALRYLNITNGGGNFYMERGNTVGYGVLSDAVFGGTVAGANTTNMNLTTAWGFNASYEHFWSPDWRTSIYGAVESVKYNSQANALLCAAEGQANTNQAAAGATSIANAGCNNNFDFWAVGSRTQWNVTKTFYMGVDVAYGKLHSASSSTGFNPVNGSGTGCAIGQCSVGDRSNWTARFRVHKDFYP